MLALEKKALQAMEAMLTIAAHSGEDPVSGKTIAAEQQLPPRYLEQLLQQLVRAGLLRGVRGPKGGYFLAREKRRITLADIAHAIQPEAALSPSISRNPQLNHILQQSQQELMRKLEEQNLQSLLPKEPIHKAAVADFTI